MYIICVRLFALRVLKNNNIFLGMVMLEKPAKSKNFCFFYSAVPSDELSVQSQQQIFSREESRFKPSAL